MFEETDSTVFLNSWPKVKNIPFAEHDIRIDSSKYPVASKDPNIYDFFTYLKLISTHRVTIENAIKSFMVFSDVSMCEDSDVKVCVCMRDCIGECVSVSRNVGESVYESVCVLVCVSVCVSLYVSVCVGTQ